MALASIPTRSDVAVTGCAHRIDATGTTTALVLDDGRRVTFSERPDPSGARRCRRSINRVVSLRIEGSADHPTARLRGLGNRLPVTLDISVAAALALVAGGTPALVALDPAGAR